MNREQFLAFVFEYVKNDPLVVASLNKVAEEGMAYALNKANKFALEMETLAMAFVDKKIKSDQLKRMTIHRLEENKDLMHFRWDSVIEQLKGMEGKL